MMRIAIGVLASVLFAGAACAQPVPAQPMQGVPLNRSTLNGSVPITTGNTFQQILPNISGTTTIRQALTIENNNLTDNCWLHIGTQTPTTGNSMLLTPGGSYARYWPFVPSDAIQATCASNGDTLYVDTQ